MIIYRASMLGTLTALFFLSWLQPASCQYAKGRMACVAFYNIENLFDTIDAPDINDEEFTPTGANLWNTQRYRKKLENLAKVISSIGSEHVKGGPDVIGLAEVENRQVLDDLVAMLPLQEARYGIVHYDSPDRRGIDVALLYKKASFVITQSTVNRLNMPWNNAFFTRDQLVVSGLLDGELVHFIVNHWPSRASGPEFRAEAAKLTRRLTDSLLAVSPSVKIMIMGDLNDDPVDPSITEVLGAKNDIRNLAKSDLYNPYWQLFRDGKGTLTYRNAWNLFDQIIVSAALISPAPKTWKYSQAEVHKPGFILEQEGAYAGYPLRSFAGGRYTAGYSDHLPSYILLSKE